MDLNLSVLPDCLLCLGSADRNPVVSIEGCFDRRLFRSIKVDSIEDKSQFDRRLRLISFRSVISESDNLFVSTWAQNKSSFSRHFTTFVLG